MGRLTVIPPSKKASSKAIAKLAGEHDISLQSALSSFLSN